MDYKSGKIDLHLHSTASDGSLSPDQILHHAVECGLKAIAITDHDTVAGAASALDHGVPENLDFLTGVEISAGYPQGFGDAGSIHILGYGITLENELLNELLEKQQQARTSRNPRIIEKLNRLDIKVSIDEIAAETGREEIARPHIAAHLVRKGYAADMDEAFDRYLARGRPAYVDKFRAPAAEAIEAIGNAGGIAVLAHPGLLAEPVHNRLEELIAAMMPMGLGGIEAYYPGHTPGEVSAYQNLAEKFDLLVSGGTDFHGEINPEIRMGTGLGDMYIPYEVFEQLAEAMAKKHELKA